jgi:hypothetical protein
MTELRDAVPVPFLTGAAPLTPERRAAIDRVAREYAAQRASHDRKTT